MIVTTNTIPKFCAWCGNDLRHENILPAFNTWKEREQIVNGLLKSQQMITETRQLSLF